MSSFYLKYHYKDSISKYIQLLRYWELRIQQMNFVVTQFSHNSTRVPRAQNLKHSTGRYPSLLLCHPAPL